MKDDVTTPADPAEEPLDAPAGHFPPSTIPGAVGDPLPLDAIAERVRGRFPDVVAKHFRGELTLAVEPEQLLDVITFCRDDEELSCPLLADLSAVHWPAGEHVIQRQASTTGWPEHRVDRDDGIIEVLYILRSIARNHWLRIAVAVSDVEGRSRVPSVTPLFPTANFQEREAFDLFGVVFEGHPNLERILMPDDWLGHPQRKDYPLGGVDVTYKNDKFIPPPHERDIREIVE